MVNKLNETNISLAYAIEVSVSPKIIVRLCQNLASSKHGSILKFMGKLTLWNYFQSLIVHMEYMVNN